MTEITLQGKSIPAYLALPKGNTGPGVLVLHAWWGLNEVFKGLCDRLAAQGFVALAPDLYGGNIATTREEAHRLMRQMDKAGTRKTLNAAIQQLASHPATSRPTIGLVGFSMGGYYALGLACQKPKHITAAVTFYGTGRGKFAEAHAAFLGHYAEDDEFESLADVRHLEEQIRAAGKQVAFYVYPGTKHWFFEENRPEYDPTAAGLAWERTVAFLREQLA
jgi:carboxymethylenebutenolidase